MSFVSSDHVVTTGDIIRSLALGGTTQFANSQKLNFIEKGKITSVLVKVGDKVKKGDILATISSDADSKDRESTMRNLRKKEEELQKLEKNNIKNRELDIKEAEIDYEKTVQELNSLPQSQKIESESKLQDLKEKKKNYERKLSKRM